MCVVLGIEYDLELAMKVIYPWGIFLVFINFYLPCP